MNIEFMPIIHQFPSLPSNKEIRIIIIHLYTLFYVIMGQSYFYYFYKIVII